MSLEFYSNVDTHAHCLMYLNLNIYSILRVECQFQSLFVCDNIKLKRYYQLYCKILNEVINVAKRLSYNNKLTKSHN
jgi:hypothetical protein